jgi:hypothetical protein
MAALVMRRRTNCREITQQVAAALGRRAASIAEAGPKL